MFTFNCSAKQMLNEKCRTNPDPDQEWLVY